MRTQVPGGSSDIGLKLETLQPIGSFKIRGAGAALRAAPRERLSEGVYTASAGNMAQGVAWTAREMGVSCRVIVPEHAPLAKIAAVERLGGVVTKVPFARWWQVLVERSYPGLGGLFVHPVADPLVIAGNATIAREILEDAPDVDTVLVPFGGGGLSCGIALGLRSLGSTARVIACEVETAPAFEGALAAGGPVQIEHHASFVDGIGGRGLLDRDVAAGQHAPRRDRRGYVGRNRRRDAVSRESHPDRGGGCRGCICRRRTVGSGDWPAHRFGGVGRQH